MSQNRPPPPDSAPAPFDVSRRRRVQFDPTINLGHLLTFAGFIVTGGVAYMDVRERLAVHEVKIQQIDTESSAEKVRIRETLRELRDDQRELRRGVDQLLQRRVP